MDLNLESIEAVAEVAQAGEAGAFGPCKDVWSEVAVGVETGDAAHRSGAREIRSESRGYGDEGAGLIAQKHRRSRPRQAKNVRSAVHVQVGDGRLNQRRGIGVPLLETHRAIGARQGAQQQWGLSRSDEKQIRAISIAAVDNESAIPRPGRDVRIRNAGAMEFQQALVFDDRCGRSVAEQQKVDVAVQVEIGRRDIHQSASRFADQVLGFFRLAKLRHEPLDRADRARVGLADIEEYRESL